MEREEILKEINKCLKEMRETEKKIDSYFSELHRQNSEAIDEIIVTMLGGETNEG